MQLWSMIAAALTLAVIASAQAPHESPTMVLPITGVPLSVEKIEKYVFKFPDGTSATEIGKSKYYRDAVGRTRMEVEVPQPFGDSILTIQLDSRVDGFIAVVDTQAKLVHRVKSPKSSSPEDWGVGLGPNGLVGVSGKTRGRLRIWGNKASGAWSARVNARLLRPTTGPPWLRWTNFGCRKNWD